MYLSSVLLLGLHISTWSTSSGKNSPTPKSIKENNMTEEQLDNLSRKMLEQSQIYSWMSQV